MCLDCVFYLFSSKIGKTKKNNGSKSQRKRKRSTSSSSSSSSTSTSSSSSSASSSYNTKKKQLKRLQKELKNLKKRPIRPEIRAGDELLVPVFDPSRDDAVIENWLAKVDNLAERYRWDDDTVIRLIPGRLRGNARQWYDENLKYDSSWNELKTSMCNQFRKSVPFSKLLKDAANYEAKPGQNLGDYGFNKLSKLKALNLHIPDSYLVDAVIGGITDENIARAVKSAQHTDANVLYAYLNSMGNMPYNKTFDSNKFKFKPNQANYNFENPRNRDSSYSSKFVSNKPLTCFNCGLPGHIFKDCKKKT